MTEKDIEKLNDRIQKIEDKLIDLRIITISTPQLKKDVEIIAEKIILIKNDIYNLEQNYNRLNKRLTALETLKNKIVTKILIGLFTFISIGTATLIGIIQWIEKTSK